MTTLFDPAHWSITPFGQGKMPNKLPELAE